MIHETPRGGSRTFVSQSRSPNQQWGLYGLREGSFATSAAIQDTLRFSGTGSGSSTSSSTRNQPSHTFSAEEGIADSFVTQRASFSFTEQRSSSFSVEGAFFSSLPCLKKVRRVAVIGSSKISAALEQLVDSIARSSAYGPKARVPLRDLLCVGGLHAVL